MNYITTTDLRTKSSELVDTLKAGVEVTLVHRSKIIGTIRGIPHQSNTIKEKAFAKFLKEIRPAKPLTTKEKKDAYSRHLKERYG